MDYEMEELIPIAVKLAEKYAGCDSTSITYEKAQMLMEGVLYCLKEYQNYSKTGLDNQGLSVGEKYRIGAELVQEKAVAVRKIQNEMTEYFDDYNVECLRDTVQKGIPEFLKWYDAKFCPQNTILTLDYPLMKDISSLSGVDAVYAYICGIRAEQLFLKEFEQNYVTEILHRAIPGYKGMMENVCEVVLLNAVGHGALDKPFHVQGFEPEEYELLERRFRFTSGEKLEEMLRIVLKKIVGQIPEGGQEMLDYFNCGVKNMAVRIDTAARTKQLDKIFLL